MNVPKLRFKGYKEDVWKKEKLSNTSNIFDGTHETPNYIENGIKFVSVENINNIYSSTKYISELDFEKYKIKPEKNNIFMTRIGDIGTSALYDGKEPLAYYVSLALIKTNIVPQYLNQYIKSNFFQKELYKRTIHVAFPKKINTGEIGNCEIRYPDTIEQIKIANMLQLLDKKIELQSKKIEALKLYKIYVRDNIITNNEYHECKLKDILTKWNLKNKNNEYSYVESVSNKFGFISQSEQFEDRNVASSDKSNYYIIKKNVFAYNPSRLDIGSLALKKNDKISLVSPLYECFTTTQNTDYMLEWFNSKYFRKETFSKFEGGVRNTLNFSNLSTIKIKLPTIEKQKNISNILLTINMKIELEINQYEKLNKLKKGLMQNMFV